MDAMRWMIGGVLGALLGGVVWVAIGLLTGYEVGWIAWGVGFVTGMGVRMMAGENEGAGPGVAAVGIAVGAIVLAKYVVVVLAVHQAMGEMAGMFQAQPNHAIAGFADEIVEKREAAGEKIAWPPNHDADETPIEKSYPETIWTEAQKRWETLPADEQTTTLETKQAEFDVGVAAFKSQITDGAFKESFSPMDGLWFILAALTAYRIGSGSAQQES